MLVKVDPTLCQGYVCCLVSAPEVFDVDDESGKAVLIDAEPAEALRAKVMSAVSSCPTRAISVEG